MFAALLLSSPIARAATVLDKKEVMPVGEIRPGMKGHGLTVFKGTKIEQFTIEVLSVMPKANLGKPLILVRLGGGPITQRGAFGIQGMSGSPCYINGRLIGAFAYAFSFPKEPIGMITPIEDMAEALDPRLPNRPAGFSTPVLDLAGLPHDNALEGAFFTEPRSTTLRPLGLPVMVNGLNPRLLNRASALLAPFNLAAVSGPGRMTAPDPGPLGPGSAIGVSLLTGDIEMTGVGTVTYRKGKELLAFGHPMFQLGATNFPITTAYVHEVFPSFQISFKMASPVRSVGTLVQDRPFSVAGRLGAIPAMVPLSVEVQDQETGRGKTYNVRAANHPFLISRLLPIAANQAIFEIHSVPGDTTAQVDLAVDAGPLGTIRRSNVFFDPRAVDIAAVSDLTGLMMILNDNAFERIPIKNVRMKVTLQPKRDTAVVERIFVSQEKYEPGDTVDVGVVMRPYRGEPFVTKTAIKIPENAAAGRATLVVSGGPAPPPQQVTSATGSGTTAGQTGSAAPPAATNVRQLLRRFLERERNDQLVTRIQFSATAVNVNGETLSLLPSHLAAVMRSSKTSGVRLAREEVRAVQDMRRVVGGSQSLAITIEQKDRTEKPGSGSGSGGSTPGRSEPASGSAPAATSLSFSENETSGDDQDYGVFMPAPTPHTTRPPARRRAPAGKGTATDPKESAAGGAAVKTDGADSEKKAPTTSASVLGRKASSWRQSAASDFEPGTLEGVAVLASGGLRPAPALRLLCETPESYVWSVAAVGSEVYAGTGNSGLVYRIGPSGNADVFFRTGELEVHALAKDARGTLYAGTSPGGKVFRIHPNGHGEEILALNPGSRDRLTEGPAPPARFVLSLAVGPDGSVYAGTGPEGVIYRIPPTGEATVFFRSPERYIQSLLVAPDGTLYAGTAESGLIYAIREGGSARVLHDSDQSTITALARDTEGVLYAGTAPRGQVLRVASDGSVKTLWDKSKEAITALARDERGRLYAAAGGAIHVIDADGEATTLSDSRRAQLMALDFAANGDLFAGSANVGTVYRLEAKPTGVFESVIHDARAPCSWGRIRWRADGPADGIRLETRSGNSAAPDATWSDWQAPIASGGGFQTASPPGRYLQYRVTFTGTGDELPTLNEVTVAYLPQNRPPTAKWTAPTGGEYWKGTVTLRWTGADPDRDTLAYDLSYSSDGKTWLALGRPPTAPAGLPSRAQEAAEAERQRLEKQLAANPALARFREALALDADVSEELKQEVLKRADSLISRYDGAQSASSGKGDTAKSTDLRDSTFSWDTTKLPDGVYRLRVVASDRPSNPSGYATAEAVSDPITIANHPPAAFLFRRAVRESEGSGARIDGLATGRTPLAGAQFRVNGGEWMACEAADGIWDSAFEPFTCMTGPLASGEHTVEVKVADAAGNTTTRATAVRVN